MEDLWMASHMIHVSILLQCPNPLAFHPLQAVPVSLDLAGGLSLSPLVFCFFCLTVASDSAHLYFDSSFLFFVPYASGLNKEQLYFCPFLPRFLSPMLCIFPPPPHFSLPWLWTQCSCVHLEGVGFFFFLGGGAYPIITNQKVPGGSCHRNLVHGSWRSSHPLTPPSHWQNCISHNDNNIISEAKGKKKRRREGGYRP